MEKDGSESRVHLKDGSVFSIGPEITGRGTDERYEAETEIARRI